MEKLIVAGATFSGLETGIIAGYTAMVNFAMVGAAFEGGVLVGSIINVALPQ